MKIYMKKYYQKNQKILLSILKNNQNTDNAKVIDDNGIYYPTGNADIKVVGYMYHSMSSLVLTMYEIKVRKSKKSSGNEWKK